jgi:general secretion pathway protein L
LFKSVQQAVAWFIAGLAEAIAGLDDWARRRAPIRLVHADDGYAIEQRGVGQPAHVHLDQRGGEARLVPDEAARIVKDHDVDLVLPGDHLLVRTLDPLPPDSKPYLDNIVRHQLERLVPWRAENVLHSYRVAAAGTRDERLVVTIYATARSLHAPILSALAALAPRKVRLVYPDLSQPDGDVAIDIGNGGAAGERTRRIRQVAMAATLAVLVAGAAVFATLGYAWTKADDAIAANEQSVADLRKQLARRGGGATASARDLAAILTRRRAQPPAALVLDAMATALPDDTWLTEFQIADGSVRVTGVSHNVAGLVPLIEASPLFKEATFFAPTTRLPDGESDRFHLQARLMPSSGHAKETNTK